MARKTITYEEIRKLSPTELGKMSKSQLTDLLRKVRIKTQNRLEQLEKVSKNVYSPAADILWQKTQFKNSPTSKMSRNQVLGELFAHQAFHSAKTSTVSGAREVQREQDIRLFGKTPSGRPKKTMTLKQRIKFWAIYEEFQRTFKNAEYLYGSNKIQQALADMMKGNKIRSENTIDSEDLNEMLHTLEESIIEEREERGDYEFDDANVYSGRWTN